MLSGTLRLEYGGALYFLETGSAVHFNAELPHRFGAEKSTVEVLLVAAKPTLHQIH